MATGGQDIISVPDYDECPVCRECLKDPRTLNCEHYFCRICLEGLVRENPQGPIKCATCREVTRLPEGSGITDLPRHEGMYSFQDQVTDFLTRTKSQVTRTCDLCRDKKVTATCHCFRCRRSLCEECLEKHKEKAPTHDVFPMSEHIFCASHVNDIVVDQCKDCKRGVCVECLFGEHSNHLTVDIKHVAHEGLLRLKEFLTTQSAFDKDDVILKRIQSHLDEARKLKIDLTNSLVKTRKLVKEFEGKLDQMERDIKAKLAAGIKTLSLYEADIKDMMTSRQSLVEHATYLTDKASEQELVEQEKQFPSNNLKVSVLQNIADACIELPALDKTFIKLTNELQQVVSTCVGKFVKQKICNFRKVEDLEKQHTVTIGHMIGGITLDSESQILVARTNDVSGPLKMYDYQGQLQETLGAGIKGLADCAHYRSVCIDTKRDCYLAPCRNTLVLVDKSGKLITCFNLGSDNSGVAYHKESDCYLVSDLDKHTVYLIDPGTTQVTRQIGSPGSGPSQFSNPFCIHVGTVAGLQNPTILVSDWGNHSLKVFDFLTGRPVRSFGTHGQGDNQLSGPVGLTTDPQGRLLVCDRDNNRIGAFSTNGGKDSYSCLLYNDWGGNKPCRLALDSENMVLAIVGINRQTLYIYT